MKNAGFFGLTASLVGLVFGVASALAVEPAQTFHNNPVVATVDGQPIRLDEVKNAKVQELLFQAHDMQKKMLKRKIIQRLQQNHPELEKLQTPKASLSDISRFYNSTPGVKEIGSMDQMKEDIQRYLEEITRDSYYEAEYQMAVERGWVVDYFEPPNDFSVVGAVGTAMLWYPREGESQRRVFVLEYSDFQCPFCKRVQKTLKKMRSRFGDKVQFGYRHYPLPFHKEAGYLAEAAECARDQSKFWELQTTFYNTVKISKKDVVKHAEQAGVKDSAAFLACLNQGKYKDRVYTDLKEGGQMGIQGTPTFIVGIFDPKADTITGDMFSGAVGEDVFAEKIEKFLARIERGEVPSSAVAPASRANE
jgi:protein-disulfide isomerase